MHSPAWKIYISSNQNVSTNLTAPRDLKFNILIGETVTRPTAFPLHTHPKLKYVILRLIFLPLPRIETFKLKVPYNELTSIKHTEAGGMWGIKDQ